MKLPSDIRFVDKNIQNALYKLEQGDDSEQELYKFINQALDNIEQNAFCRIQIPKKLIPKDYTSKYNIKNLWKYAKKYMKARKLFCIFVILKKRNKKSYLSVFINSSILFLIFSFEKAGWFLSYNPYS